MIMFVLAIIFGGNKRIKKPLGGIKMVELKNSLYRQYIGKSLKDMIADDSLSIAEKFGGNPVRAYAACSLHAKIAKSRLDEETIKKTKKLVKNMLKKAAEAGALE